MKRIATLILTVLLLCTCVVSAVSCTADGAPDGMYSVSAQGVGFQLYVPETWLSQADSGISGARFGNGTDKSNVTVTMYVPNIMEEGRPSVYWSRFLKTGYEQQYADFALAEESYTVAEDGTKTDGVAAKLGGRDAVKYIYTMTFGGVAYKQMQVIAQGTDANVYIFTYTAKPENFDAHLEAVAEMLKEFRFG